MFFNTKIQKTIDELKWQIETDRKIEKLEKEIERLKEEKTEFIKNTLKENPGEKKVQENQGSYHNLGHNFTGTFNSAKNYFCNRTHKCESFKKKCNGVILYGTQCFNFEEKLKKEKVQEYKSTDEELEHCMEICKTCINFTGDILKNHCKLNYGKSHIFSHDKKQVVHCGEYKEKQKFNEPWKPEEGERYYFINTYGFIGQEIFTNSEAQRDRIINGNIFKTYEQAEQEAKEEKVKKLLKNFSEVNWDVNSEMLFQIYYNEFNKSLEISGINKIGIHATSLFSIKFTSKEVAQEALRLYEKELEELRK